MWSILLIFIFCIIYASSEVIDYGNGNILEIIFDENKENVVSTHWISLTLDNGERTNVLKDSKHLSKRWLPGEYSDTSIVRFCAGYSIHDGKLRSIIKRDNDNKICRSYGWSEYMKFYVFDGSPYKPDPVFGVAEAFNPHRSMVYIGNDWMQQAKSQSWMIDEGSGTFGFMQDSDKSVKIEVMVASNGYWRTLLNIASDPWGKYTYNQVSPLIRGVSLPIKCRVNVVGNEIVSRNPPTLNGWSKSGRIIHAIVAVRYNTAPDDCHHESDSDVVNHQTVLARHELHKRDIGKGKGKAKDEGTSKENVARASDKLAKDFADLIDLWELPSITPTSKSRYSIVGGFKNIKNGKFKYFADNTKTKPGSSFRIDLETGIVRIPEYPNMNFANIQLQWESNTYGHIQIPFNVDIGKERIKMGLIEAIRQAPNVVRIVPDAGIQSEDRSGTRKWITNWVAATVVSMINLGMASPSKKRDGL